MAATSALTFCDLLIEAFKQSVVRFRIAWREAEFGTQFAHQMKLTAVTVQRPEETSCNFTAPIATFGALRNPRELLLHPNCTQISAVDPSNRIAGASLARACPGSALHFTIRRTGGTEARACGL